MIFVQLFVTLTEQMAGVLGVAPERVEAPVNTVYHHGMGMAGSCVSNQLAMQAIAELGGSGQAP